MDLLTIKTAFVRGLISKIVTHKIGKHGLDDTAFALRDLEITKGDDTDKFVISASVEVTIGQKDLEEILKNRKLL